MGIFDSLNKTPITPTTAPKTPEVKPTGIFGNLTPGPSTPLPSNGPSAARLSIDSILKGVKIAPQSTIPKPIVSIDPNNSMDNNNYDPNSTSGLIKNTIKGIPKATLDTTREVAQGIARTVGSVGITAGNSLVPGKPSFENEVQTDNTRFSKILFGGKPIKTVQKTITDTTDSVNQFLTPRSDLRVNNFTVAPFVLGSIALDLSFFGGAKGLKSFAEKNIPEGFFKYVANEESAPILKQTLNKIGFTDEVLSTRLAEDLAKTKTVQEAKTALINFEKTQLSLKAPLNTNPTPTGTGVFDALVKTKPVDNIVNKGTTPAINLNTMTDVEVKAFVRTPEGSQYIKDNQANMTEEGTNYLYGQTDVPPKAFFKDQVINPEVPKNTTFNGDTINYPLIKSDSVKMYAKVNGNIAKIDSIEIKPSSQKQGVGTQEVYKFEQWAKNQGANKVEIDGYKNSIGFWEKLGYKFDQDFPVINGVKQDFKLGYKNLSENKTKLIAKKPETQPYKETGSLTTKILKDLEGKTTVSRQYILDATNRQGISGPEAKIIKETLAKTKGDVIQVAQFAESVKKELIPLKVMTDKQRMANDTDFDSYKPDATIKKYESVSLPREIKGDVKSYKENVYQGKVKTEGSGSHFSESDKYMLHTRVENMADGTTRRVIEVQSDLYQKGRIADQKIKPSKDLIQMELDHAKGKVSTEIFRKEEDKYYLKRAKEITKLEQYKNHTIHYRGVREEIKKAADEGIEKLQFPTGETAMKIEGLGETQTFGLLQNGRSDRIVPLTPDKLSIGAKIKGNGVNWIITDVLENGKFKAIQEKYYSGFKGEIREEDGGYALYMDGIPDGSTIFPTKEGAEKMAAFRKYNEQKTPEYLARYSEEFDISGKVDTSNPIYKFYEDDLSKFLKNNYQSKIVTDPQGVKWNEVDITKDMKGPVTAFKRTQKNLDYSVQVSSKDVKKIIGDSLNGIVDPEKIEWIFDTSLKKQGLQGRFSTDARMESINPRLKPIIELYKNWFTGDVSLGVAFHEVSHYLEEKVYTRAFVNKLDDLTSKIITKSDIRHYRNRGYEGDLTEIYAEYRADAFATERLANGEFKKGKIQKVLELMDKAFRKIVSTIKKVTDHYKSIPNKQGGFARNPLARKLEENLPDDLQRIKDMIDIKEQVLRDNPLQKLVKYQSSSRPGELPELNDIKNLGKGKFNQKGDSIIDEVMGYKYDHHDQQDVNDVRDLFEKFMEDKKKLTQMKRDFQVKRVDFITNLNNTQVRKTEMKVQAENRTIRKSDIVQKDVAPFKSVDELIKQGKARVIFRDGRDIYQFKQKNDWISTRDESTLVNRFNPNFKDLSFERNLPDSLNQRLESINLQKRFMRENPLKAISSESMKMVKDSEIQLQKDIKTFKENQDAIFLASSKKPVVAQPYEGSEGELRSLETVLQENKDGVESSNFEGVGSFDKIISQTQTSVKDKVNVLDFFRTPDRVLTKIGFGKEAKMARNAYDEYAKELPKNIDMISHWSKQVSKESNTRIFKYLDGKAIDLTPKEKEVATEIKLWLKEWATRLDLPEDNTISHYITHIFDAELIAKEFDEDLAKIIADKVPGQVYDPFLQRRLGAKGYKQDTWAALDAYVKRATRKVHMDPVLAKIKEKAGGTLETSNIEKSQFNYIKNYVEGLNMRPTVLDEYFDNAVKSIPGIGYKLGQRPVVAVTRLLRQLTYKGMLGLNPASALRNLSQGVNTYAILGEKNTIIGYSKLFKPSSYRELIQEGVLNAGFVQDRVLSSTKKVVEKIDKGLFAFFETAEKINRGAAYFGAKSKYWSDKSIMNKTEQGSIEYAKNVVRKTQFAFDSVDTPVALQGDIAKTLLQFQTFSVKQIEFLQELAKNKNYSGLLRYLVASVAFVYTVGQAFGMKPTDILPSLSLGTPPSLKFPVEVTKAILDTPDKYGQTRDLKTKGKDIFKSAIGLFPAGSQIKKTYEGIKANKEGGMYDTKGRRLFKAGTTEGNTIQNVIFGPYSTQEAQDYFKNQSGANKEDKYADIKDVYNKNQELKSQGKKDEAESNYENLSDSNKKLYKEYKTEQSKDEIGVFKKDIYKIYDKNQELKSQGKNAEAESAYEALSDSQKVAYQKIKKAEAIKSSQQTDTSFIGKILAYSEAIGTDPVTAFNLIMDGEKIRRVDNKTIIVERMPLKESQEIKRQRNGNTPDFKLDHTIPLELGGTNAIANLKLVPTEVWKSYSPIENYLGKKLSSKKLSKSQVLEAITRFKNNEITADEVRSLYN